MRQHLLRKANSYAPCIFRFGDSAESSPSINEFSEEMDFRCIAYFSFQELTRRYQINVPLIFWDPNVFTWAHCAQ